MKFLEKGLHAHFEALQQAQNVPSGGETVSGSASTGPPPIPHPTSTSQAATVETPFAKVNSIASGSPADEAGLKAGDTIRSFGGINWVNHERLTKIGEVVQQNEGVRGCYCYDPFDSSTDKCF
jgi:26S proteasome non-ATPase regulatory subunit 9